MAQWKDVAGGHRSGRCEAIVGALRRHVREVDALAEHITRKLFGRLSGSSNASYNRVYFL
jgi:hypothetical protein